MPASGGPDTLILDREIHPHLLMDRGLYFIDGKPYGWGTICFYEFATRRVSSLAPVHGDPGFAILGGLSVSPDGKWLLYSGGITNSDIMRIDNFRCKYGDTLISLTNYSG